MLLSLSAVSRYYLSDALQAELQSPGRREDKGREAVMIVLV